MGEGGTTPVIDTLFLLLTVERRTDFFFDRLTEKVHNACMMFGNYIFMRNTLSQN